MLNGFDIDLCAQGAVLPGLRTIEYAPADSVSDGAYNRALSSAYNQQDDIPFDDAGWRTLPVLPDSGAWAEDLVRNDQGDYYDVSVSATVPADAPAIRGEMNAMRAHRYLLRITPQDGVPVIVGSVDMPLRFESRFQSGAAPGEQRGYRITFSGPSLWASPGYTPVF